MKRILILFSAVLLMCSILDAQPPASIIPVTADPSGSCFAPVPMQFNSVNGKYWGCVAGTWTQITGGGGGSGTVTQVDTGSCLKGGPITTTGTIALDGAVNPQTSTYQVLAGDFTACKTITVASGTFTITLVASGSQPAAGQYIGIINYGAGVVTVAPSGQNINGSGSSLTLGAGSASAPSVASIISDGTNYFASTGSPLTLPIPNSDLANSSTTVNGQTCTLGSTCSISAGSSPVITSATGGGQLVPTMPTPNGNYVAAALNLGANVAGFTQFVLPVAMDVTKVAAVLNAASASGTAHCDEGIYSADGSSLLLHYAIPCASGSSTAGGFTSFTKVTLTPGTYWLAVCSDQIDVKLYGFNMAGVSSNALMNTQTQPLVGKISATCTSGALPSSFTPSSISAAAVNLGYLFLMP